MDLARLFTTDNWIAKQWLQVPHLEKVDMGSGVLQLCRGAGQQKAGTSAHWAVVMQCMPSRRLGYRGT